MDLLTQTQLIFEGFPIAARQYQLSAVIQFYQMITWLQSFKLFEKINIYDSGAMDSKEIVRQQLF